MVREPNLALYGIERLDPPEEQFLQTALLHAYHASDILRRGAAVTAREAVDRIHGRHMPFVLHYDVDVISSPEFTACGFPAEGSLCAAHVREALAEVVASPQLLAIELCEYFPELDADGSAARFLVEMFAEALAGRLRAMTQPSAPEESAAPASPPSPGAVSVPDESVPAAIEPEAAPAAGDSAIPVAPAEPAESEALSAPASDAAATSAGE
jgi:hypothetical protein